MLTEAADKASTAPDLTPKVELVEQDDATFISLSGRWVSQSVNLVDSKMRSLEQASTSKPIIIDASQVSGLDTAGAWLIVR